MVRKVDGPEITGQVTHKQTGQAYGPVTVAVTPKVYTDPEMTASVTSLTTDGTGVFSCYAPPGNYTFTTTAVDSQAIEPVEVLGREGGTGVATAASNASGLLSARPAATGSKGTYYATDTTTMYEDTAVGVWTQVAEQVGAAANSRLVQAYGTLANAPIKPGPSQTAGANLWAVANFSSNTANLPGGTLNTTALSFSVAGTGANNYKTTRVILNNTLGNEYAQRYRLVFTVDATALVGGGYYDVRFSPRDNTGALLTNYTLTTMLNGDGTHVANQCTQVWEFDYSSPTQDSGSNPRASFLDFTMYSHPANTSGSATISNVSLYRIHHTTPTIRLGWDRAVASGAVLFVDQPTGTDRAGNLWRAHHTIGPDGVLELGMTDGSFYMDTAYTAPDKVTGGIAGQYPQASFRKANSGQVLTVYQADGVTTELRGNQHNGEIGRSGTFTTDYQVFLDFGDGTWVGPLATYDTFVRTAFRVKIVALTKMTRSDQPGVPFLNVDSTYYLYADGTIRKHEKNTFLQDQKIDHWFKHMMTSGWNAGESFFQGRLGSGNKILGSVDFNAQLAAPVMAAYPTVSATGGVLTAGTYQVFVTAFSRSGETDVNYAYQSPVTVASGTTNSVVATWGAVSGALGYYVYFGYPGRTQRVAVVTGAATYTITGSESPVDVQPPAVNRAYTGTTRNQMVSSGVATWSAYLETITGQVVSMAINKDEWLTFPHVVGARVDLQKIVTSITKNYYHLMFDGADLPQTIPNGSIFETDLWWFHYCPADRENFWTEQILRASSAAQLPGIYTT